MVTVATGHIFGCLFFIDWLDKRFIGFHTADRAGVGLRIAGAAYLDSVKGVGAARAGDRKECHLCGVIGLMLGVFYHKDTIPDSLIVWADIEYLLIGF